MYIAGRVRTCSIPSSTLIMLSVYAEPGLVEAPPLAVASVDLGSDIHGSCRASKRLHPCRPVVTRGHANAPKTRSIGRCERTGERAVHYRKIGLASPCVGGKIGTANRLVRTLKF